MSVIADISLRAFLKALGGIICTFHSSVFSPDKYSVGRPLEDITILAAKKVVKNTRCNETSCNSLHLVDCRCRSRSQVSRLSVLELVRTECSMSFE